MALIKDYFEKTKLYKEEYGENTIVLMQVGSFYEVYGLKNTNTNTITGSQILDFSCICDLHIADKKICVGKNNVLMAGFSYYMIEKYLKKLQESGYTTVVYSQDEDTKNTTRSLSGIYSPGTYFSNELTHKISNNTTCIWLNVVNKIKNSEKYIYVGVANIDIYTGKTSIFEFNEIYINSPTTFDQLERFISIYNPSEVIVIGNVSNKEIDNIINYGNIQCKSIHCLSLLDDKQHENKKRALNCEKQNYQKTILEKFFKIVDYEIFSLNFYQNVIATQSFCYLLDFIYQHNPNLVNKLEEPTFENCSDRLILANHSLKQLNIIDDGNYSGQFSSVDKLLNLCITPMGKRKFSYNLSNPTTNKVYLQEEYNITEYILNKYSNEDFISQFKNKLSFLKDIPKIMRLVVLKKITPNAIFILYNNLKLIKEMYHYIENDKVVINYFSIRSINIKYISLYCDEILSILENNLDLSLCEDIDTFQQFSINFIKKGVDYELDENTKLLLVSTDKLEAIRNYLNDSIMKYEKKSKTNDFVKLHETEKNSFSLVSTKRRCNILKEIFNKPNGTCIGKNEKINLEYTSSYSNEHSSFQLNLFGNLVFNTQSASNDSITSSEINDLCKSISSVKIKMKDLITSVYVKFLNKMEEEQEKLNCIIDFVTIIDLLFSKVNIVRKFNYCKPNIVNNSSKSFIDAKNLRHCLIEHIQQNELYVTNDIELGKILNGILLYGTNAVGKTSLIRAIGITVVMAQAGLYVPCSSFDFYPYKYIFTRILGNDNIFKGLSTFAVEMSELRTILRLADSNSLILGDELCSGTESISATSIFVAGIQQLYQKNSSFIFATHLHEIINYEELTSLTKVVLKHMAVVYDREKDLLVYDRKLKDGPGNNMYGLEVCRSLNLPTDFLEAAHNIRMKYHPISGSILSLKTSHYNSKKIIGNCEVCEKEIGSDVHHLQHQQIANENGYIKVDGEDSLHFHKNHLANLMTLCKKCHDKIHKEHKMHKKVKTTKGTVIKNIYISNKN